MHSKIPDLISVKSLAKLYPEQFSENRTRDLIYHAESRISARGKTIPPNGFACCIVRRAGRVLIDLDAIPLWLEKGRAAPLAESDGWWHEPRHAETRPADEVRGNDPRQHTSTPCTTSRPRLLDANAADPFSLLQGGRPK